jgi:hypothetical protein
MMEFVNGKDCPIYEMENKSHVPERIMVDTSRVKDLWLRTKTLRSTKRCGEPTI